MGCKTKDGTTTDWAEFTQMRRVILIRPCVCFGSVVILVQYLFGGGCVDDVYQSVGVSGQVECSLQ